MPTSSVPSPSGAATPFAALDPLLRDLLAVSLTGVNVLRPVYGPAGELVDFAIAYLNPAGQRMTGLAEEPGGTLLSRFPHVIAAGILGYYRRVYAEGATDVYEVNYQADELDNYFRLAARRSGEWLVVSFTDTADQDRSAVEVALRNSQAAEQAARADAERERQRFFDVLMQLPAQVAVHEGPDQVFTLVNPGYQRMAPGRDLLGQPIRAAWPELASQGILDVLDHVYRTGKPFIGTEVPLQVDVTRTGRLEQVYLNAYFLPLRDAQDRMRGVLDFSYDVTEQVRARQQLEQLNQDLETRVQARTQELTDANRRLTRTNVDLDTFVYTASHDLKAPITNIDGLLEALRHELPEPAAAGEVPHILGLMQDSVHRFKRTLEHLTAVGTLQKEPAALPEQVALEAVLADVRLDLAPLLQQTGGRLDVDVDCSLLLTFSAKNLRAVVYNLLSNALKYRHPDRVPHVKVRTRLEGAFALLEVQDNGLGLDLGRTKQLFGMFQRFHTHVEGTGIGLYMVKRMVENAGGRIDVQSEVGEGSTFTVFFPQ